MLAKVQASRLRKGVPHFVEVLERCGHRDVGKLLVWVGIQDLVALVHLAAVFGDHRLVSKRYLQSFLLHGVDVFLGVLTEHGRAPGRLTNAVC